jgi:hypothetical protein
MRQQAGWTSGWSGTNRSKEHTTKAATKRSAHGKGVMDGEGGRVDQDQSRLLLLDGRSLKGRVSDGNTGGGGEKQLDVCMKRMNLRFVRGRTRTSESLQFVCGGGTSRVLYENMREAVEETCAQNER